MCASAATIKMSRKKETNKYTTYTYRSTICITTIIHFFFIKLLWNGKNKMLLSVWALNVDIQDWRLEFYSSINAAIIKSVTVKTFSFFSSSQFSNWYYILLEHTFSFNWMENPQKKKKLHTPAQKKKSKVYYVHKFCYGFLRVCIFYL